MVEALAPAFERVVCTEVPAAALHARGVPGAGSHPAGELARACAAAGLEAEVEPDFAAAVRNGRRLAAERGGILLVTGSHYVLQPARQALGVWED
jgi:hypothetical protein